MSSKNDGSVTSTYTYDWNDRLSSVDQGTTNLGTYTYTDARQRLSKTVGTSTKYYVNTAVEFDGTDYQNFVFAGTNRVASIDTGGITYNHTDHLQSSSLQTDSTGGVTSASTYKPFGSTDSQTGTGAHDYTYTDQENDVETGLMYYDARYYSPELKRFTSVDPWFGEMTRPQSFNKYSYTENNPIKYIDPTGEASVLAMANPLNGYLSMGWYTTIYGLNNGWYGGRQMPITARLLEHGLSLNPESLSITQHDNIGGAIVDSPEYQSYIKNVISQEGGSGNFSFTPESRSVHDLGSLELTSNQDLAFGIHNVTVGSVQGTQNDDGLWNINANFTDTYDYKHESDYGGFFDNSGNLVTTVNNLANASQKTGLISNYELDINLNSKHE